MNLENVSIGVDIEEVSRFRNKPDLFLEKIFTKQERVYCGNKPFPEQHYAARFCAKEAFLKALSGLYQQETLLLLNQIEVYNDTQGRPSIRCEKRAHISCQVSLSHDQTKAIAFVIMSRDS